MHKHRTVYLVSWGMALATVIGGGALVVAYGFTPPRWLLVAELAVLSGLALLCGFTAALPAVLPWLKLRPVQGALLVGLGVASIFLPPQFLAAAVFLTLGIRAVWASACELAEEDRRSEPAGTAIVRAGGTERQPAASLPRRVKHVPMVHPAGQRRPD